MQYMPSRQRDLDQAPGNEVYAESQPGRWMVLTQNLAAASTTTVGSGMYAYTLTTPNVATANPAIWQASANSGKGGYAIDTTLSYYVQEATGKVSYSSGDWVYCRALTTAGGTVWEPLFCKQQRLLFGQTTGALSGSNPIVNNITAADTGASITTNTSDTIEVINWPGWTWSGATGVTIMFVLATLTGTPGSGAQIGTGNFVNAPCGA